MGKVVENQIAGELCSLLSVAFFHLTARTYVENSELQSGQKACKLVEAFLAFGQIDRCF
jgi:hypothetical protein